jgi:hypothetical protein
MAKIENTPPPYWPPSQERKGYFHQTGPYGPQIAHHTSRRTPGPSITAQHWFDTYGVNVVLHNRQLRAQIAKAWKTALTPQNRANWNTEALTVTIDNFKTKLRTPNGFELFMWHHFFNSARIWPTSYPFEGSLPPIDYDPPSPYVLPDAPSILGLNSETHDAFSLDLDNWPAGAKQLCLTSIQTISIPNTTRAKSHKFTGKTASGTGAAGIGVLNVSPLYPWQDPATGTKLRFGLRYLEFSDDTVTAAATPAAAADAGDGPVVWQDPTNVCVYDATFAHAHIDHDLGQHQTNQLHATDFSWVPALADTAEITGIEVELMGQCLDYYHRISDLTVRLLKAGTPVGENKAYFTWPFDKTFPWAYFYYYAPDPLWGQTWVGADLNNPLFGVAIAGQSNQTFAVATAEIPHIKITVWSRPPNTIPSNPTYYNWIRPA